MTKLSKDQWGSFNAAKKCHICFKEFSEDDTKVRDHCHYTGLYRGPAHRSCNLRYRIPNHIPVVFHNLSGYDAHLFIRQLGRKFNSADIGVIAENKEKYITFSVNVVVGKYKDKEGKERKRKIQLRFIDSIRFMGSSLDSLSSNLTDDQCKNLARIHSGEEFQLMRRKGIYPYEYIDCWEKFNEDRLPSREEFYSRLNLREISEKDYEHALAVWNHFKMKNLGEYHDRYLQTDVILLSDIFETFRETCLKNYGLDPAQFYTSPGLAWQGCLKKTGVELELLSDPDMLLMFERGIRGGITQAVHRYARANNKYMDEKYDPEKESSFLQYLDANNLYGWAMVQKLPTGGFNWVKDVDRFTMEEIDRLVKEDQKGYLLEVDVNYPKELHDAHNDLPFLCEKMKIDKVEKLVPNLYNKRKFVVHIKALDQTLKHRLILEKVHRVIEFDQSAWLKSYIDFNTKLRTEAKYEFEKDFFKLMNNSVFGKTMENIRQHKDIKLATNETSYLKKVMKPNFKSSVCFR